jgi:hypothetical protein
MLSMILLGFALAPSALESSPTSPSLNATNQSSAFATAAKRCPELSPRIADERSHGARARRLDELPPGRLELAVLREIDGCAIPAVVHEGIGGR